MIWVGNNYNGDLAKWAETPISSYLEVGGNVLLMSRRSHSFLDDGLTAYLGVTWMEEDDDLGNCVAVAPGLVNIPFIGTQSYNDVYQTTVGSESTLLFNDTAGFSGTRGTGVWASPAGGGTFRNTGGQFVQLSGSGPTAWTTPPCGRTWSSSSKTTWTNPTTPPVPFPGRIPSAGVGRPEPELTESLQPGDHHQFFPGGAGRCS